MIMNKTPYLIPFSCMSLHIDKQNVCTCIWNCENAMSFQFCQMRQKSRLNRTETDQNECMKENEGLVDAVANLAAAQFFSVKNK